MLHPHFIDRLYHFFQEGEWTYLLGVAAAITGTVFIATLFSVIRRAIRG